MSEGTTITTRIQTSADPLPGVKVEHPGHLQQDGFERDDELPEPLPPDHEDVEPPGDENGLCGDPHQSSEASSDPLGSGDGSSTVRGQGQVQGVRESGAVAQQQINASATSHQKFQDVRVDNWGNYCLQRLQVMHDRGDFCDLTLQFNSEQTLKVHRVVVNLCTEYFANLERMFGLTDGVMMLPKDIEYQAMVTIIKFFYTGKLEIRGNQFSEVYRTVKLMNITILIKLLEAHAKKPVTQAKKEPTRPIVFKQAVEIGRPLQKTPGQLTTTHGTFTGSQAVTVGGVGGTTKTLQVTTPGVKLPPGVKTKTVLARVQSQSVRVGQQNINKMVSQKKLPIWKERKFVPAAVSDPLMMEKWPPKDEPARPTRFEWGDPDEDPSFMSSTVVNHSLMEKHKGIASGNSNNRKVEDIFDAVKHQNLGKRTLANNNISGGAGASIKVDHTPAKVQKIEHIETLVEVVSNSNNDADHVNLTDETVEEEVSTTEVEIHTPQRKSLKPALKSNSQAMSMRLTPLVGTNDPNFGDVSGHQDTPTNRMNKHTLPQHQQHKSVRFASDRNNETDTKHLDNANERNDDFASSHSKIIAEVLKKYPDLVKDKQNIKLKIVQKGTEASSSKDKSKVSYIVLKSTSSPDSLGAVLLKKPQVPTSSNKAFWDAEKVEKKPSGAENTAGPWLCGPCGGGDESPLEFETYYSYRRHLVDAHAERIDARICEYCGQRASKRNLLLYHLYTKHGVSPPKNTHFPHCDRCDYVALSESLLNKHKMGHDAAKEYSCLICNASFKSTGALHSHMAANLHRNKDTKLYECPYCRKPFVRNINLKGHIRAVHRDIARLEEMDDPRLPVDESLANRSAITFNAANKKRQFPAILGGSRTNLEILSSGGHHEGQQVSLVTADGHTIEILHGIDPNSISVPMQLVPSSEAEAMTNVASSIAASLGLEAHSGHGAAEFMTGMTSDGSQAVYIMDSSQPAVEVDMSAMGLTADGSIVYGDDTAGQGQFIVQDIHGNQFRKITGIDETGKPVVFFQLSEESGQMTMAPAMLEDGNGMQIASGSNSVFVSSGMPVTVSSDGTPQQTQVLLTRGHDGTVYEVVSTNHQDEESHQVVMSETELTSQEEDTEHHEQFEPHEPMSVESGQGVQELHIVLDQGDSNDSEQQNVVKQEGSMVVEHEAHPDENEDHPDENEQILPGDNYGMDENQVSEHSEETLQVSEHSEETLQVSEHSEETLETQHLEDGEDEPEEPERVQTTEDETEEIVENLSCL